MIVVLGVSIAGAESEYVLFAKKSKRSAKMNRYLMSPITKFREYKRPVANLATGLFAIKISMYFKCFVMGQPRAAKH